jgi:hypothetical protein
MSLACNLSKEDQAISRARDIHALFDMTYVTQYQDTVSPTGFCGAAPAQLTHPDFSPQPI